MAKIVTTKSSMMISADYDASHAKMTIYYDGALKSVVIVYGIGDTILLSKNNLGEIIRELKKHHANMPGAV